MSVQLLSHVRLFVTPWTASLQASLFITSSQSLLKVMSIVSVMPSNYLILYHPLLLLPSIFPCIRVFSNQSAFHMRWPKFISWPKYFLFIEVLKQGIDVGFLALDIKLRQMTSKILFYDSISSIQTVNILRIYYAPGIET